MLTQLLSFRVKEVDVNETKIEEFKNRLVGQVIRPWFIIWFPNPVLGETEGSIWEPGK